MRAIPLKLRSQRGASMLLALLFLLICSMVTASILMAAAANAGKHRSNLEEHQTYLALSSAVSLLCDELNGAEYRGRYYYEVEEQYEENDDGELVLVDTLYYLDQSQGTYDGTFSPLLLASFDRLFADAIEASPAVSGFDRITYQSRTAPLANTSRLAAWWLSSMTSSRPAKITVWSPTMVPPRTAEMPISWGPRGWRTLWRSYTYSGS